MCPLLLLLLLGCARGDTPSQPPTAAGPAVYPPQGPTIPLSFGEHQLLVELADTEAERQQGLMYREGLAPGHGMLFVYPDERERGFWMRNTLIPLSIAFLDRQGRIVHIADMQPLDETTTRSQRPAMYAVEADQGWFAEHGVHVGAKVEGLPEPSRE